MKKTLLPLLFIVLCFVRDMSVIAAASTDTDTEPTLANISTRAFVETGDNVVIGGFIIERAPPDFKQAPPKRVIIRAIGPELTQYGIPNALANPTLELYNGAGALIASNNNWVTTIIGGIITSSQVDDIRASGHAPTDPFESAIIADLPAGSYTAVVRGVNNMTGVALVEVYDLSSSSSLILGDLSTRGYVQTADNVMIGGFSIPGTRPKGIVLRALGPELSKYGIPDTLANPALELYDSTGALLAFNDSWQHTVIGGTIAADQVRDILNSDLAPEDQNEPVINATLPPGDYTAVVRGVNNTTGVALLSGNRTNPTFTWTGAADSHWENSANWNPTGVPDRGDIAAIPSGPSNSPTISDRNIEGVQLALGSPNGGSVTLDAASVHFSEGSLSVTGGTPGASTINATLACQGDVSFALAGEEAQKNGVSGLITVEAGSALTIDAGDGTFTLTAKTDSHATDEFGTVTSSSETATSMPTTTATHKPTKGAVKAVVTQESSLFLKGHNIVTEKVVTDKEVIKPIIEIEGAADIAEDVTLKGEGIISLDSGGRLFIKGAVGAGEQIDFADGTGRISIATPAAFLGTVGFTPVTGAQIDFPGIQAQSVGVQHSGTDQVLKLYAEPNRTGGVLAHVNVQTVRNGSKGLFPYYTELTRNDFALSTDGNEGARVTFKPGGTTNLDQSMPVPLIAPTGSMVPLRTIFSQSFGTSKPGFYSITLRSPEPQTNTPSDYKYWINVVPHHKWRSLSFTPAWFVHGKQILPNEPRTVREEEWDNVELMVGNNIDDPAQFQAQVTRADSGLESEIITYSVWTVDPRVASRVESTVGKPEPTDIVAAADSLERTFPDVPNSNLCNWIADNVAAVAGASQPLPNFYPDPTDNVEGGFWRMAYTGARPNPVTNWFTLVRPGDIIRMQHDWGEGHTTTALSGQHPDGTVTVYSNSTARFISIHPSTAEEGTNPASITIYRLDPKHQYLILGTSLGEVIQGSVYDNLFRPGGGSDMVIGGPNNNEIQDTTSNLDGITVKNFHAGDLLNFTDRHPSGIAAQYDAATARLTVSHNAHQIATITIPGLNANAQFSVTSNPAGGSNITLLP